MPKTLNEDKRCVVVPSRGRSGTLLQRKKHTLIFTAHSNYPVFLVVRRCEFNDYEIYEKEFNCSLMAVPDVVDTIAKTYDFVFDTIPPNFEQLLIMDDDLIFAERPNYNHQKLTALAENEWPRVEEELFDALSTKGVVMSGLVHRRGANNQILRRKANQKLIACMACDIKTVRRFQWHWGFDSMFDHNMVLTLLCNGYNNVQLTNFCHDDVFTRFGFGGCEAYRNSEDHGIAARELAKRFPEVVKLRTKWVEKEKRFEDDVTMYMKKAFGDRNVQV